MIRQLEQNEACCAVRTHKMKLDVHLEQNKLIVQMQQI